MFFLAGYDTTANELSPYMLLAFRYLLSPNRTWDVNQHLVHPYSYWFSHQKTTENLMRGYRFPDVIPRVGERFHLLEEDFMDLLPDHLDALKTILPPPSVATDTPSVRGEPTIVVSKKRSYSYVVTLFFIDTSPNILSTLQQIYDLLQPGGVWINLGPLLWTSGGQTAMELSLEEILTAIKMTGFVLDPQGGSGVDDRSREVECEYTADPGAMMRWIYLARFWVARKPA